MQVNSEAMTTEITTALGSDLSTMVKKATKEVVGAAKGELREYINVELTTMVSSVEMYICSLLQKLGTKLDSTPTKDAPATPTTIPNQTIADITPDRMYIGQNINFAHYLPAQYHTNQYTTTQMLPVVDQFWHTIHQYYEIQGSNNTMTSSQQLTNG
eukprot:13619558-Ditylum_brightwellii.AAC.1